MSYAPLAALCAINAALVMHCSNDWMTAMAAGTIVGAAFIVGGGAK